MRAPSFAGNERRISQYKYQYKAALSATRGERAKTMYYVQITNRATENNKNFAGEVHVSVYGKDQKQLAYAITKGERYSIEHDIIPYFAIKYGYKRACDARRSFMFNHVEDEKYWTTETKIIWLDY